jgi:hypothetical protein
LVSSWPTHSGSSVAGTSCATSRRPEGVWAASGASGGRSKCGPSVSVWEFEGPFWLWTPKGVTELSLSRGPPHEVGQGDRWCEASSSSWHQWLHFKFLLLVTHWQSD